MVTNCMDNIISKDKRFFWMGCAITYIYLYHLIYFTTELYSNSYLWKYLNLLLANGFIGVDLFLFVSAYGLCHSFKRNKITTFYSNRIIRIIPIYVIFLILLFFCFLTNYSWQYIIFDSAMQISGISIFKLFNINIEWFIPALIFLYITFPIPFYLVKKTTNVTHDILIIICLTCLSIIGANFIHDNLSYRLPIWIMGILTYKYQSSSKKLFLLYFSFSLISLLKINNTIHYSTLLPLFLLGFNHLLKIDSTKKFIKYFSKLGLYSLEIYLAQVLTTKYFLPTIKSPFAIVNCILLTITISILFIFINIFLKKGLSKFKRQAQCN